MSESRARETVRKVLEELARNPAAFDERERRALLRVFEVCHEPPDPECDACGVRADLNALRPRLS